MQIFRTFNDGQNFGGQKEDSKLFLHWLFRFTLISNHT